ncbi:extracellular solute-binding protein [Ferdinandcohnia quinoae]|uniref:Extracellular solute-binding protein n=1 Tax=Fredinandcohnia quinoae TaxID=2918902 RepID=A0AAW5E9M3_9BACI|nr:extracellular solute-binding protein [Fredinandcohnia sp. SECRCQ15]MCH1627694.1 extracellular solute-binding protein [Fredinandcohnia sp. SECRCQ15]
MKKYLFVAVLIFSMLLTACSSKDETGGKSSDEKVAISIWHNFAGDDLRAQTVRGIIEQFKKDNPDVKVDEQAIPVDGYRQRISTVAAADELPDIFLTYAGSFTDEFYEGKMIQPITALLDEHKDWRDGFLANSLEVYDYDGEIYSAPVAMSATSFLYYNKKLFEENNVEVPKTWDELLMVIDVFNEKKITPIAMGNQAPWVAQSTTFGAIADRVTGSEWFMKAVEQDGASFTDPVFIEALGYFKQLVDANAYQEGANAIDNTQAEQYFAQGNAAMMINGSWTISSLAASVSEDVLANIGVAVVPSIPEGEGKQNTITGGPGGGFLLNSKTEGADKDAALDLIYALSNADAQKAIAETNSMVMYDVDVDQSKVNQLFYDAFNLVREVEYAPVYDLYLTAAAGEAINLGLQEIMLGKDVESVAKKLQEAQSKK